MNNKREQRIVIHINDVTEELYSKLIASHPLFQSVNYGWSNYTNHVRPTIGTNFVEITKSDTAIKVLEDLNIPYDIINVFQDIEKTVVAATVTWRRIMYGDTTYLI